MKPTKAKKGLRDGLWVGSSVLLLGLAAGVVHFRSGADSRLRSQIETEINFERSRIIEIAVTATDRDFHGELMALSEDWTELYSSGPRRIEQLSEVANAHGVRFTALTNLGPVESEDTRVVSTAHGVSVQGRYEAIAGFVDGLQSAVGVVGIDRFSLEADESCAPGNLRADMRVSWYSPSDEKSGMEPGE